MKKVVLVLFVLLMSLTLSNNSEKNSSKRVFEQGMKYLVAQDYKAYRGSTSEGTTRGNLIFLDTVYKGFPLI